MTIEQKVALIIEDVCAADPSLHGREAELRPIVRAILDAQPDTRFDDDFSARVRKQVLAEASKGRPAKTDWLRRLHIMNRNDAFVLGTAALGLLIAITVTTVSLLGMRGERAPIAQVAPSESFAPSREHVLALGDGAFGNLGAGAAAPSGERGTAAVAADAGRGGTAGASAPMVPPGADEKMAFMPQYEPVRLRYVYKGEIGPAAGKVTVYRRAKGFSGAPASAVTSATRGVVDLTRLQDPKIQSFSLLDDREYGYNVFVDVIEGTVAFSQLWQRWPHPDASCTDPDCFRRMQLTPEQVPPDAEIITIADGFLGEYGIAKDSYGAPAVHKEFARAVAFAAGDASLAYIPESVPVTYPVNIDGLTAHERSGEPAGVQVGVNIRHKRVDNVWGLAANVYESSSYDGVTDPAKLRAYLENGGMAMTGFEGKTIDVAVGDPVTVLVRVWKYQADGMADELFVPALRFPVLEAPKDQPWTPAAVVVPLAKDAIEEAPPIVMPLDTPMTR